MVRGVAWEELGTVSIKGNALTVYLSARARDAVVADAIRIQRVSVGPVFKANLRPHKPRKATVNTQESARVRKSDTIRLATEASLRGRL